MIPKKNPCRMLAAVFCLSVANLSATEFPPVKHVPLFGSGFEPQQPVTPAAIRQFRESHPVLPHYPYPKDSAIAGAEELLSLKSVLSKLIPTQFANIRCACPECGKDNAWRLNLKQLDKLECGNCNKRFPSTTYKENHTETYRSYFGETVGISYHKAKDGTLYCFQGKLEYLKFKYLTDRCEHDLGYAYHLTGDERYAKLACQILSGLAENAQGFLAAERGRYITLLPWPRDAASAGRAHFPPHFSPETKGNAPFSCGVFPGQQAAYTPFIDLYDLTYASPVYDTQKNREKIDCDFFGRVARYMEAATECFGDEPHEFSNTGNICSQYSVPARIARMTGRWEDMRLDYYQELRLTLDRWRVNYDAMSAEGPGYHLVWLSHHLQAVYHMMHMQSPPGAGELRRIFDKTGAFEVLARSRARIIMPNKTVPNLEDMGKREKPSEQFIAKSICNILPGYGHAVLGAGSKPMQQIQAHLQFSRFDNHAHRDALHLNLFAKGREMYADIGTCYTDGSLYSWAYDTLSHNTVVVDEKGQKDFNMNEKGNLEVYAPNLPGLSMVRVAMDADGLDRYRRSVILNSTDADHPYVVDIFEVHGGRQHDYSLHGSSNPDLKQDLKVSLPMKKLPGESPLLNVRFREKGPFDKSFDTRMLYHFLTDVSISEEGQEGPASAEFIYRDNPRLRTRAFFHADPQMRAISATSPSVEGRKFWALLKEEPLSRFMPHLLLRRTAKENEEQLRSLFVVIHEPIDGQAAINGFQWAELDGAVGITVRLRDGREDRYIVSLEENTMRNYEGLQGDGVLSAAITQNINSDLYTIGGTLTAHNGKEIRQATKELAGSVLDYQSRRFGAEHNAIITDAELPLGSGMAGEIMVLEMNGGDRNFRNGYEIIDVRWADEAKGTRLVVLRDDPMLKVDEESVSEWYYPFRKAKQCRVVWQPSASSIPRLTITPNNGRYCIHQPNARCTFDQKQQVTANASHPDAEIKLMIDGASVAEGTGKASVVLDRTAEVTASVSNPCGVYAPPLLQQTFQARIAAQRKNTDGLKPGLELRHSGNSAGTVAGFDISAIKRHQRAQLNGYIEVPNSGTYTIYSYAFPDVQMWIGGVPVISTQDDYTFSDHDASLVNWFPVRAQIALEAGIHPLRMSYYNQGSVAGAIDIEWEGPNLPRERIGPEHLFHN